jgi:F420-0:gamma-glutamyl ligase
LTDREANAPDKTSKGRTKRKSDPTKPRQSSKRALLGCILGDTRLTADDRKCISQAHRDGVTLQDLAALTVYQLRLAQTFFESGDLAGKDLIVALGKVTSAVAAAAQLGQGSGPGGAATITVTFVGSGPTSDRPEAAQTTARDDVVGDVVDVE